MLEAADRSIDQIIALFSKYSVEAAYLVPTKVGLEKSILDAHTGLNTYLKIKNFHDYQTQGQGTDHKKIIEAYFVTESGLRATSVSLYRPQAKAGDARLWISDFRSYAEPGNVIAFIAHDGRLYIVNCSDRTLISDDLVFAPHLLQLAQSVHRIVNEVSEELLVKLREVSSRGWVQSMREGPTGVGYTLETLLGISANSSRAPDYKGIEIKAGRTSGGRVANRTTLFSKTPNWKKSAVRNGLGLLDAHGYRAADGRLQLYCSLNNVPNTLGHYLSVPDDDEDHLYSLCRPAGQSDIKKVLLWEVDTLLKSLRDKHKETFWIKAEVQRDTAGREQFRYTEVMHTQAPLLANFVPMIKLGQIELDYVLHEEIGSNGSRKSRDHGYLFKIWSKDIVRLFPPPRIHSL